MNFKYIFILAALYFLFSWLGWVTSEQTAVYFLDVGQGDASLIVLSQEICQSSSVLEEKVGEHLDNYICQVTHRLKVNFYHHRLVLIDGGPDRKVVDQLGDIVPFWRLKIDLVVLTHPHADHTVGLEEVMSRYKVDYLLLNPVKSEIEPYLRLLTHLPVCRLSEFGGEEGSIEDRIRLNMVNNQEQELNFEVITADNWPWFKDQELWLGDLLELKWPEREDINQSQSFYNKGRGCFAIEPSTSFDSNLNNDSVVLELNLGPKGKVCFMGDAEEEVEEVLLGELEIYPIDHLLGLKAGHHCSKTSSSLDFIKMLNPNWVVCSVGENSYGHPGEITLDNFDRLGVQVFRTDEQGRIKLKL